MYHILGLTVSFTVFFSRKRHSHKFYISSLQLILNIFCFHILIEDQILFNFK